MTANILEKLGTIDIAHLTLREAYGRLGGDAQSDIPRIVRLFENPCSWLPFPGKISLREHDMLHLLLDRGIDNCDEAFIVGFTLGNDERCTPWHHWVVRLAGRWLYPEPYRFSAEQLNIFDFGYLYGKQLRVKNLNHLDFAPYLDLRISHIRQTFGIDLSELRAIARVETILVCA